MSKMTKDHSHSISRVAIREQHLARDGKSLYLPIHVSLRAVHKDILQKMPYVSSSMVSLGVS